MYSSYTATRKTLLFVTVLMIVMIMFSALFSSIVQHRFTPFLRECAFPTEATLTRLCQNDCTSHEIKCVDWDGYICRESSPLTGCCPSDRGSLSRPCEGRPCCYASYTTCVSACVQSAKNQSQGPPGPAFEACLADCRLKPESWYGSRWRSGTGTLSPTHQRPYHCYGAIPWPAPSIDHQIQRPLTHPATTLPSREEVETPPSSSEKTVKIIEFH